MKTLSIAILSVGLLSSQVLASGCSEMAAFNTKVNNFLETANLSSEEADGMQPAGTWVPPAAGGVPDDNLHYSVQQ